jgi:hypothetical protein
MLLIFGGVHVAYLLSFLCCALFFVPVLWHVLNVACVSGVAIIDVLVLWHVLNVVCVSGVAILDVFFYFL